MFGQLFNALVRKKSRVIRIFQIFWIVIIIGFYFALNSLFSQSSSYLFWYGIAVLSGKTSLIFFVITLTPGIFNRFLIRNRLLGLIRIFRRQFGITMFLLAAFHGIIVSLLPTLLKGPPFQVAPFQLFGTLSLLLLFFLFVTSNDISEKLLKVWWFRLHRLVYIIMWFILFHVALQRLSIWTAIASVLVISELAGIIYSKLSKKES